MKYLYCDTLRKLVTISLPALFALAVILGTLFATADSSRFNLFWHIALVMYFAVLLAVLLVRIPGRANILLVMCSVLISLYGVESWLTTSIGNQKARHLRIAQNIDQMGVKIERDIAPIYRELRQRGIDAYPFVHPFQHLSLPLSLNGRPLSLTGTVANKLTVHCRESSPFRIYMSDRYGFSNPDSVWDQPVDMMFVGDSYTHGACVNSRFHFTGIIREKYPRLVNLGGSGAGPLNYLASLREFGPFLKPKLVVWTHVEGNDSGSWRGYPPELMAEMSTKVLIQYLEPGFSQHIRENWVQINPLLAAYALSQYEKIVQGLSKEAVARGPELVAEWERTKDTAPPSLASFSPDPHITISAELIERWLVLSSIADTVHDAIGGGRPRGRIPDVRVEFKGERITAEKQAEVLRVFKRTMARAKADVEGWGGKLVVVWAPLAPPYVDETREQTLEIFRELGLQVIDAHDTIKNFPYARDLLYARNQAGIPGHLSEEGNVIMANLILKYLETTNAGLKPH